MKKVAIVGVGPTGIYTFHSLVERGEPLEIVLYEQGEEAGVGMPYNDEHNSAQMLANIASIEIPPIYITYLTWLQSQSENSGSPGMALSVRPYMSGNFYRA